MNAAERKARNEGYQYAGSVGYDKEQLKKKADNLRGMGFLVRTIDNSLYTKYKALKPEEIPPIQESYNESLLEISNKTLTIELLEGELKDLQERLSRIQNEKRKAQELAADLKRKLNDSGVVINTQNPKDGAILIPVPNNDIVQLEREKQ